MSLTVVYEERGYYAEYSACGMLHSWWRKLKTAKSANYVEKLNCFRSVFHYGVKIRDPEAHPETDGWPKRIEHDAPTPPKKKRKTAKDLL